MCTVAPPSFASVQAEEFYDSIKGEPYFGATIDHLTSDVVTAMELVGNHAIHAWRDKIGASDATKGDPTSLRKVYGADDVRNGLHGSDSITSARNELEFFFGRKFATTAIFNNCTCAVPCPPQSASVGSLPCARPRRPVLHARSLPTRASSATCAPRVPR